MLGGKDMLIIIKGAGDLASGVAHRLKMCHYNIIMTDLPQPTTIRRTVAFSPALLEGQATVENVTALKADDAREALAIADSPNIAVIADPKAQVIRELKPDVVIDAVIAKKNIGTVITDAPLVIGLGPGFTAGVDCHCVIETQRGHDLGRVIYSGAAAPNTGVPGDIEGYTTERILRAPRDGLFQPMAEIGAFINKGQVVALVKEMPVVAEINGILRGILPADIPVFAGMKSGDIDPRCQREHCFTISDKARSIGGGVLEAILHHQNLK